ncbi:hypothetical protein [Telmatospirillum sp. J64-1]|uniref:hypothetical protein n=1 Tax=Telmatospirillum sp. J64-1 TaxID=2502183 RepID=UPI00115CA654|nr:hypothetical protein [Telmatospirillum sp. J64-1]
MREQDDEQPQYRAEPPGASPLMLSVFLLLLAFFILLNSLSTYQDVRGQAVLESVKSTFSPQRESPSLMPERADLGEVLAAQQSFQDRLQSVMEGAIPAVRLNFIRAGRELEAVFHSDNLFVEDQVALRPGRGPFLDGIAAAMAAAPPGLRFEMDVMVGVADGAMPVGETLEAARAGLVVREMGTRGLDGSALAIGMERGHPGRVRLVFRVRGQDAAAQPSSAEGGA